MSLTIMFIGDVIGSPGREMVRRYLPRIKEQYGIDFAILNAENIAGGFGVTLKTLAEMSAAGADMFVAGSAIFSQPDYQAVIAQMRAELAKVHG